MKMKPTTRRGPNTGPHDFNGGKNWYYVNSGSIDVCNGSAIIRISREALQQAIQQLRPLLPRRKRATR